MDRRAKIVATIGPSCNDEAMLTSLIEAGVDVARLNFSHGTHEDHARRIACIRMLSLKLKKPITILQDLQGPKMRVGWLPKEGIVLKAGQTVRLVSSEQMPANTPITAGDSHTIPLDIPDIGHSLKPGKRILLDDGNLELVITAVNRAKWKPRWCWAAC